MLNILPSRRPAPAPWPSALFRALPGASRFEEGVLPTQPVRLEILQNVRKVYNLPNLVERLLNSLEMDAGLQVQRDHWQIGL